MTALQRLSELDHQARRARYPNVPLAAIPPRHWSDRTANGLTACILRWLELHGHKAWRQSSEGRYRRGERITDILGHVRELAGKYLPGTNRGHGDISALIGGVFTSIECKVGRDRQRPDQKRFQEDIENSGGHYVIVRSMDSFVYWYQQLITSTPI